MERAESVAEEIRDMSGKAVAAQADVTACESFQEMVARIEVALGAIGVLVNNAGNVGVDPHADTSKPFRETGPHVWNSTIGVNFCGVLNCVSAVVPGLIQRKAPGRIITIISDAARFGDSGMGMEVYARAKPGAARFTRGAACALGRYDITANDIAIAYIETPTTADYLRSDPERLKRMLSIHIVRRSAQPYDITNMALFLAADASSRITG
ncbi:SDR family NAD(P)-dependent oxidoreductase [Nocardia africana]|uniref:SDR family NAD(P)-dependent oxidoreductase n=1 Tax=Nocardia africana TaxID=134964 RepID=A0ABW6NUG9_9NOCA